MSDPVILSDGFHTMDELYRHRAALFVVVVSAYRDSAWKSIRHSDGTMFNNMFIVGVDTPFGQITYHYDIDPWWPLFDCNVVDTAPEWDGHTSDDVIDRLIMLGTTKPDQTMLCAGWVELPTVWRSRRKYECSGCGAYVTGRFRDTPVDKVHKVCHSCGAKMIVPVRNLLRDSDGFVRESGSEINS